MCLVEKRVLFFFLVRFLLSKKKAYTRVFSNSKPNPVSIQSGRQLSETQ